MLSSNHLPGRTMECVGVVEIDGQVKEPQYAQEEDFERQQPALMGTRHVDFNPFAASSW